MGSEKFCLRWNDFESNISVAFRELREDKDFFDVTLSCDDEQQLQAHKVILSACSPFFRNILRRNPHQHPLLYLKGVKYTDLQSVLNFMYHGEVNVAQEELNSFLAVAEDLRVKGLTQSNQSSSSSGAAKNSGAANPRSPSSTSSSAQKLGRSASDLPVAAPPAKRPRPSSVAPPPSTSFTQQSSAAAIGGKNEEEDDDDIQEVVPVKSEPRDLVASGGGGGSGAATGAAVAGNDDPYSNALATEDDGAYDESYEDYGQYDQSYDGTLADPSMGADGNKGKLNTPEELDGFIQQTRSDQGSMYLCTICNTFTHKGKTQLRNHVESKHFPGAFSYSCRLCSRVLESKKALENHTYRNHRQPPSLPAFFH